APGCRIDTGGGLVSKNPFDNKHYLTGIISVFPSIHGKVCDNKRWVLFTQVSKYMSNFIIEKNNIPSTNTDCQWNKCDKRGLSLAGRHIQNRRENQTVNLRRVLDQSETNFNRNFDDPRDTDAQFSTLKNIFVPENYQGELQNYLADIAVLITENSFTLTRAVEPVCIDWVGKYENQFLRPSVTGFVSGWGFTRENSEPSEELKDLEVPYIERDECEENLPSDYDIYLTSDKICSGFLNKSRAVCSGDSGGGLVFKNMNDGRYYIAGIVSLSPQAPTGGCDSQQYALYTKVAAYINDFVLEKVQLNGCILPEHPILGEWSVYDSINTNLLPGMWVPAKTVLQIKCDTLYKLSGPAVILCTDGKWSSNISQCLRTCPPRYSTAGTKVMCTYKDNMVTENCTEAIDDMNAVLFMNILDHLNHELICVVLVLGLKNSMNVFQVDYVNQKMLQCNLYFFYISVCGQKPLRAETLIINGTNAKKDDYPWKCVTNFKGEKESKDIYNVAVGKYYRDYDDPRDADRAQFSTVDYHYQLEKLQEIFIPEVYKGTNGNFFGDIAVLVTTKTFKISRIVQPVCVDWVEKYNIEHLNTSGNLYGYVTGWGFTTEGANASEELKELKVPIRDNKQCREAFPSNFNKYFTSDKICAGYLNQSASVCSGDSGNGLVIEHDARHYIAGIVSVAPKGLNGCNSQQDGEKCLLPEHPSNGQWSVVGSKLSAEPGTMISSTTTIHITCSKYHILNGPSLIQCKAGQWESRIGTCLAPCPPLTSTRSMEVNCNNDVNCMNATHGTLATFKCAPFYENLELNRNPFRTCQNGQWKPEVPICVPVCGIKPISTGRKQKPYYPWNVAVYEREGNNKNFKCAGSLVRNAYLMRMVTSFLQHDTWLLLENLLKIMKILKTLKLSILT
ncbi:Trypsin domain containing protein, partial [Asbolus verrucosus]